MSPFLNLRQMLDARLDDAARGWLQSASTEIADGAPDTRFAALFSVASRYARSTVALNPSDVERASANKAVPGWNPERWTLQEALRVALILSRTDMDGDRGPLALEELFTYADEGEQRAAYRSLALLPDPARFIWRAGEGCRTNITTVFEAVVLDTPFPALWFDDERWNQAIIKAIFVGVPLWRLWNLDQRLSPELARMALDLADERRSAGRAIQPELWLCVGAHGGDRGQAAMEAELDPSNPNRLGRCAAAYALVRAGLSSRLQDLLTSTEDGKVRAAIEDAISGNTASTVFQALRPAEA